MSMGLSALPLSFVAGVLTTLSPCVLPLLPMIVGSAASEHRYGVLALAGGLVLSFSVVGIAIASLGMSLGFDPEYIRYVGATLLLIFGLFLISEYLQNKLSHFISPLGSSAQGWLSHISLTGLTGQFIVGLTLGLVWSPCVGPTLGAAIGLAGQGESLLQVTLIMALFSLGAATPLITVGYVTRQQFSRHREQLMKFAYWGKKGMGVLLLIMSALILSGLDKNIESYLLEQLPDSWTALSVKY